MNQGPSDPLDRIQDLDQGTDANQNDLNRGQGKCSYQIKTTSPS